MILIPFTVAVILGSAWLRKVWRQIREDDVFESNPHT